MKNTSINKVYIGNKEIIPLAAWLNGRIVNILSKPIHSENLSYYEVGNSVLYDKVNKTIKVVDTKLLSKLTPENYEPIGVVVIPTAHDVYGTGECGVMALKSASLTTPDTGQDTNVGICWGQYTVDIAELPNLTGCSSYGNNNTWTSVQFKSDNSYLPSDQSSFGKKLLNPNGEQSSWYYYQDSDHHSPSPYNPDGSFNPDYSNMEIGANCLGDFDGKHNTEILCNLATAQVDWKTAASITNNYNSGHSPAACTCWRYHTSGTNQGDWYLPAAGELGYCCVRFQLINQTISSLSSWSGKTFVPLTQNYFWSSSEYSSGRARYVNFSSGGVGYGGKGVSYFVRPFFRFK